MLNHVNHVNHVQKNEWGMASMPTWENKDVVFAFEGFGSEAVVNFAVPCCCFTCRLG